MNLEDALRRHVEVLTVEIGRRTPFPGDGLERARRYIHQAFEAAGLEVAAQAYDYQGPAVANLIAALPGTADAARYYVVGAHYDTVPTTPGADDNASAVAVMLELARRLPDLDLAAPVKLVAFTREEPPASPAGDMGDRQSVVGGPSIGTFVKYAQFKGRGAHLGGAPIWVSTL